MAAARGGGGATARLGGGRARRPRGDRVGRRRQAALELLAASARRRSPLRRTLRDRAAAAARRRGQLQPPRPLLVCGAASTGGCARRRLSLRKFGLRRRGCHSITRRRRWRRARASFQRVVRRRRTPRRRRRPRNLRRDRSTLSRRRRRRRWRGPPRARAGGDARRGGGDCWRWPRLAPRRRPRCGGGDVPRFAQAVSAVDVEIGGRLAAAARRLCEWMARGSAVTPTCRARSRRWRAAMTPPPAGPVVLRSPPAARAGSRVHVVGGVRRASQTRVPPSRRR